MVARRIAEEGASVAITYRSSVEEAQRSGRRSQDVSTGLPSSRPTFRMRRTHNALWRPPRRNSVAFISP